VPESQRKPIFKINDEENETSGIFQEVSRKINDMILTNPIR